MKKLPLVSIITVNYNGKRFLKDCFDSLYNLNYPKDSFEIFMVDNGSKDNSIAFVREKYPKIKIIQNDVNNYARANNLGIKASKGKYIALINNDTKVDPNWLIELIKVIDSDASIGAVGSKILFMDGKIQSTGHQEYPNFYWGDRGFQEEDRGQYNKAEEIYSICGCSALYRKVCLNNIGLFDEDFNMYMEDVDMSTRCKKDNWRSLYIPTSIIYHKYLGTSNKNSQDFYVERNRLLFIAKHYPEKLGEALFGRGYFVVTGKEKSYQVLNEVFFKLMKHHNINAIEAILAGIIENLRKISNFDRDFIAKKSYRLEIITKQVEEQLKQKEDFLKQTGEQLKQKDNLLKQSEQQKYNLENILKDRKFLLKQKEEELCKVKTELDSIYTSTGFRFLLRPLWTLLWNIKQVFKIIKKIMLIL